MTDVVSRRDVLAGAAALVIAGGSPALAQATKPDSLKVGKAVFSSFPFAALEVGVDAGIWKSLNLDIESIAFKGDAQVQEGLTGGSIDIGLGSGPAMAYRSKGVPAIAVAVMAGRPQDMALIVAKGSDIKTLAGLKGKRIGVTTAGSLTDWLARQVSTDQGWGSDGVVILPLGAMETRVSALGSGQISASVHDLTEAYEIERIGKGTILTLFRLRYARDLRARQPDRPAPAGAPALSQRLVHDGQVHARAQGCVDQDDRARDARRRSRRREIVPARHGDDVERRHVQSSRDR